MYVVVEVSDATRDRLQGLHHCFLGWRTSCRLQLPENCEPLAQRQQQLRFVSSRDRLGKPRVKCCRVFCQAGKGFPCATLSGSHSATTDPRQANIGNILSSMFKTVLVRKLSVRCAVPRQIDLLTRNLLHEFCLELRADHVRPRPESDREPVLPRLRWRQTSRSRRSWALRDLNS